MKLARLVYVTATLLLLCLLFQVSDCGARRPSSPTGGEAWWKAPPALPAVHGRDDARRQQPTEVVGGVSSGRTPPAPDATQVLRGEDDDGVGSSAPPQEQQRTLALFLRSRLPRRSLVRTDGVKASCPSYDVNIGCPPSKP